MKLLTRVDYKKTVVVLENGHCEHLQDAIINRKTKRSGIIDDGETIESVKLHLLGSKAICIIVSVNSKVNVIYASYYKTLIYTILIYKVFSNIVISE